MVSYRQLHNSTAASRDMYAVLGTHPDALVTGSVVEWRWEDRRQIAWASTFNTGDSNTEATYELVDPTHMVVRDLYVALTVNASSVNDRFNYYIELEEVELDDAQAVMAIVQEEAQDVN